MPEYSPERYYIDLEEEILEAFILAKDSSTIQLPEGHFLFSQSLSLDGKKHLTIKGMGMDKTVLSFKGQEQGAEGIKISNSQNIILEDFSIEDAVGDNLKIRMDFGPVLQPTNFPLSCVNSCQKKRGRY